MKRFLNRLGAFGDPRGWPVVLTEQAIAGYPHPILIAGRDGSLSPANPAAEPLCRAVSDGDVPGIGSLVIRANLSSQAQIEVVMVPGQAGALLYELVVLPMVDGAALVVAKDVTLESNLRSALVESRQRYKDLVEISTDFAWELGPDGAFGFVSPRGALGYSASEMVGRRPEEFIVDQPGIDGRLPFHSEQPVLDAEVWVRRSDGQISCLLVSSSPMCDAEGKRRGARGVWKDITKEREREAALARADNRERLLTYVVRAIRDVADPADMLGIAAEATSRAFGATGCQIFRRVASGDFAPEATFGQVYAAEPVLVRLAEGDVFDGKIAGRFVLGAVGRYRQRVNGAVVMWREADGAPWNDDDHVLLEGVADQIGIANEQVANHASILALSRTDALTGLFNRRAFFEELSRRFSRLSRDNKSAALIYVDLDNFKAVNDRHGHARGDEALAAVRDILVRHTRSVDLIARLGGDEFAVWLEGADETIAVRRSEEIIAAARTLLPFSGSDEVPLTMSLGVAVHGPDQPEVLESLLQRADAAMYQAKHDGKGGYRMAGPAFGVEVAEART
ncbi:diguanylate cyclase [Telmatospirillum sp.]|uniref:sensor domain-containing diguanylate cyclase n=1 Tax=Telmatospirillum sp. TaxID=2079197 RepID=UPI00284B118C|nr:diguanylate cyclase [Telmatospirillum sp.]MDR3439199.1 diguanylate cyclase [Telmatospirillum sp.]